MNRLMLIVFPCLPLLLGAGQSEQQIRDSLKALSEKIQTLDTVTRQRKSSLDTLQGTLKTLEKQIAETAQKKSALAREASGQADHLKKIESEIATTHKGIQAHRHQLASHLRAAYRLSLRPGMDVLHTDQISHNVLDLVSFRYIAQAREQAIQQLDSQISTLETLKREQQQGKDRLDELNEDLEKQTLALKEQREQQEITAVELSKELKTTQNQLAQLKEDQAKLNQVLKELLSTLADPAFTVQGKVPFARLKGKLPWPAKGKIESVDNASGVHIATGNSLPIKAVGYGRVVFADWLRGFGLMAIIDHGDGYMSLYGNNEALFKQVGDWVEPGTVIGSTGRSGGRRVTGVYFELRHQGKNLAPREWCKNT
jgi:septal ring factor EnvC (AmiA/AmiB activator)